MENDRETPTLALSHVPLVVGPAEFVPAGIHAPDRSGHWQLGSHLVHVDGLELAELFARRPNVRLCLAGHTHLSQRISFRGVEYVVCPPVSGAWWRGDYLGQPSGFGLVDLHADGTFELSQVATG